VGPVLCTLCWAGVRCTPWGRYRARCVGRGELTSRDRCCARYVERGWLTQWAGAMHAMLGRGAVHAVESVPRTLRGGLWSPEVLLAEPSLYRPYRWFNSPSKFVKPGLPCSPVCAEGRSPSAGSLRVSLRNSFFFHFLLGGEDSGPWNTASLSRTTPITR
jgi:hypothetical protein